MSSEKQNDYGYKTLWVLLLSVKCPHHNILSQLDEFRLFS